MSHFTQVKTKLMDALLIKQAVVDLGWQIKTTGTIRGYQGSSLAVDIAVSIPGADHDIGFRQTATGFEVVADWWGMEQIITEESFLAKVNQKYAYYGVKSKLEAQGFSVAVDELASDKKIHLVLRRPVFK